jgi:UDP-4-amino-4,6-dideoxy-N-acetyl-beta-L-altrosamine N-acetyltransferase
MTISGYDIELIRLTHDDIELVRNWRNSAHIKRFMEYREHITPEMQEKWFHSIDNIHNNYFIIITKGEKIGLINGSQINWEKKETRNGGIFIWNSAYWNTLIPLFSSILLTDISFILGLEYTYIKILRNNEKAIQFNKQLGYEILNDQENLENQQYVLTREHYFEKTQRLRKTLQRLSTENYQITITDENNSLSKFYIDKLNQLPEDDKKQFRLTIL